VPILQIYEMFEYGHEAGSCASLEEYCRATHENETGRFAKLLLRLPALRSIGLKCLEHLFFQKLLGDNSLDSFLLDLLEASQD